MAIKLLEKDIQDQILSFLQYQRGFFWRNNTGASKYEGKDKFGNKKDRFIRYGKKGQCDISGILPDGRRFECEVKRPGNKPSEEQVTFIDAINYWGGVALIAYSLDDVVGIFKKLK